MIQTELHRHLDIAVRLKTLYGWAQAMGLESQSTSIDAFRDKVLIREQLHDLSTVLHKFELYPKVLDRPEKMEQLAFEGVEDCYLEGTRAVELRFSPSFMCMFHSVSWDDALDAIERGMKRALKQYPDMRAGLLCIASRDLGLEQVTRTVEFFLENQTSFIGFDLAGHEAGFPNRMFKSAFDLLKPSNAKITVHAGESSNAEAVWESIDLLGAKRIGHGIRSIDDPKLVKYLAEKKICLEICPTSNWLTRATPTWSDQPLTKFLEAGVPVCINTDDPGMFGITLPHEFEIARTKLGLSEKQILKCKENATQFSFLDL